jgi:hypothetical protein
MGGVIGLALAALVWGNLGSNATGITLWGGARAVAQDEAQPTKVPVLVLWRGSVDDENLLGEPPVVIGTQQELSDLWHNWKLAGEIPQVDFREVLVVVQTTRGGRLNLQVRHTNGALDLLALATRDLRPGFRYVIGVIPRAGLKTIGDKELPAVPEGK